MIGPRAQRGPASFLPEELLREYVDLLVRLVEAAGALIIFTGAVLAAIAFVRTAVTTRSTRDFVRACSTPRRWERSCSGCCLRRRCSSEPAEPVRPS